jgi:uncharacterized protein (DUF2336 family)
VTDFFLGGSAYSERQVAIFNGLIGHLIEQIDRHALLDLSRRLAAADHTPADVIGRLSFSDDIAVAGPILEQSNAITEANLIAVAKAKSQDHLLMIAGRKTISAAVTDVLVERGNADVARKVVANQGACFSEMGFVRVINGAGGNRELAAAIARRNDVPAELRPFLDLALG